MNIGRIWRPETFQGQKHRKHYFEGWYFKLIDQPRKTVIAVIPGIAIGENCADAHAFVQVIDAVKGETQYFRFDLGDFRAEEKSFQVQIGPNMFSDQGIHLELENEKSRIRGDLRFIDIVQYPKSFCSPGIMGPFSFVPGMECYHGVVNINHSIRGRLKINGMGTDFTDGEGYIEKDWGRSFPSSWIWLQANHFQTPRTAFMFSLARIPWLGRSFTGLIAFLQTDDGFYKFATYNGGRVRKIGFEGDTLSARLTRAKRVLEFTAAYTKGGMLKAPKNGLMQREIEESITAKITLRLTDRRGKTLFSGSSRWGGMEIAGDLGEIL